MNGDDHENLHIQGWQNCVRYAEDISSVFKHWDASYYELVNPIISYLIWYACMILLIHEMSIPSELVTSEPVKRRLEAAVEILYMSLRRFSIWWPLVSKLIGMQNHRLVYLMYINSYS